MKAKRWLAFFLIMFVAVFLGAGALVVYVDPFFHYHAPHTDKFFYTIDNQRSVNNGIVRHFDYDALITGSSMTVNFRTSELDELFGTNSIKVPASGASYFETNNIISTAFDSNPELKHVFRSIDRNLLVYGSNELRDDLGEYPHYLYDKNIFNDYKYVFNADVLFNRTLSMILQSRVPGFSPGHTSFDDYSNTMEEYRGDFGFPAMGRSFSYELNSVGEPVYLNEALETRLIENVQQNLVAIAKAHPEATFHYFFPPYSLGYWHDMQASGRIYQQFEAERIAMELMLECDNIRLYDFSCRTDIISDVNNYRDMLHYGDWINSFMLKWMHDEEYRLTKDNYLEHLENQFEYYTSADYGELINQARYNCDYYAAALLNQELTGAVPRSISAEELAAGELRRAELIQDEESGETILKCTGVLPRHEDQDLIEFLISTDYVGLKLSIPDAAEYSYLCFKGRNTGHNGEPTVLAYNSAGECISFMHLPHNDLDGGWQQFALDLRDADGPVELIFNGGYRDNTGHDASSFEFKAFELY